MSLSDNIHQLVNEHMTQADDGSFVKVDALLDQLHIACTTNFSVGRGGGAGAGMMVNSTAVKLETKIKEDALFEHFEYAGTEYQGSLKELLRTWPTATAEDIIKRLDKAASKWVTEIRAILTSKRPPWRPTLDCPSCGLRFHGPDREPNLWVDYWDHEEEKMSHPSLWSAGCDGCGAEWTGDKLKWLPAATRENELTQTS